jgi:uncharacterized protein
MRVSLVLAFLLALSPLAVSASNAQTAKKGAQPWQRSPSFQDGREKANENLLMLSSGMLGGPWIQIAHDIALTVSDGDNLRVVPLATAGAKSNLRDVLQVRGVDLAITRLDVLNDVKASGEFGPNLERRVAYITPLGVDLLQVLGRPEVNSLKDLSGKKVNVFPKGSVASKLFKTLGIQIEEVNFALLDSVQHMRTGEVYASACICAVPVPAFAAVGADIGFKLLEVPYVDALGESFLPGSLSSENFPNQIAKDAKVQTIGTHLLLITYNWPPGTERYRTIEKFVGVFFSKFDEFRQPPRHPSWRQVNISASVRGLPRFPPAKHWLDQQAAQAAATLKPVASGTDAAPVPAPAAGDRAAERERLFKEFLEWSRRRPQR